MRIKRHNKVCTCIASCVLYAGCFCAIIDAEEVIHDDNLLTIGYSQIGAESDWRIANTESVRSSLTAEDGFYLIYENAQQVQEKQIKAVRNFILQDVDYIILNPIIETGWDSVLQEANDAEIPVIIVDRKIDVEDEDLYRCWIGADFEEEGRKAGKWLEEYEDKINLGHEEELHIVLLQGTEGSSAAIGRMVGFSEILAGHDNWNLTITEDAGFTQAKGKEVMNNLLQKDVDIDVLVSENDNMTFGAIEAIHEAGKTCGKDGDITILSFDAVSAALDLVEEGLINADFECNPLHGPKIRDTILALEAGEDVDRIQYMEETYFDTDMDIASLKTQRTY